jgi:LAO/AO transport system kinase
MAAVAVLDAAGFPVIFVETVGAGQAEIDVADVADAVVVVTVPGLGDEIQALKAGLLEIADLLVVNKADREGADHTVADLTGMLALGARPAPPILSASAATGGGLPALVAALESLRAAPGADRDARRRRQAVRQVIALVGERARDAAHDAIGSAAAPGPLAAVVDDLVARRIDPWSAAEALTGQGR